MRPGPGGVRLPRGAVALLALAPLTASTPPAAAIPENLSLASADVVFSGEAENDNAGWSVAWVGDVIGDGTDDLMIGAPGVDGDRGRVYVLAGRAEWDSAIDLTEVQTVLDGVAPKDEAGRVLAGIGDLDEPRDGRGELVIAAPKSGVWEGDGGAVYIIRGGDGLSGGPQSLSGADVILFGEGNSQAGSALDTGDVDGDGVRDLVVGAPQTGNGRGSAYVVFGHELLGLPDQELPNLAVRLDGVEAGQEFGAAVAVAGDVNGRGTADVIVGAPGAGAESQGAVYLYYSDDLDSSILWPETGETRPADAWFDGEVDNGRAGIAIAGIGNIDGLGSDDFAVGMPGDESGHFVGPARIYLFHGKTSDQWTGGGSLDEAESVFEGMANSDLAGIAIASGGDLTGDDVHDLLIAASAAQNAEALASGAVYLCEGPAGLPGDHDIMDAEAILAGVDSGDRAGEAVAVAGDVDGDGVQDVVIGARYADRSSVGDGQGLDKAGQAYLVLGGAIEAVDEPEEAGGLPPGVFYGGGLTCSVVAVRTGWPAGWVGVLALAICVRRAARR